MKPLTKKERDHVIKICNYYADDVYYFKTPYQFTCDRMLSYSRALAIRWGDFFGYSYGEEWPLSYGPYGSNAWRRLKNLRKERLMLLATFFHFEGVHPKTTRRPKSPKKKLHTHSRH